MTFVAVEPSKLVEVLVDATWYAGELEAGRRQNGRWVGYVRYAVAPSMRDLARLDQAQLRQGSPTTH